MKGHGFSEHENQGAALTTVGLVMDFFCLRKKENGNLKKFENRSLGPDALICVFEKGLLQRAWHGHLTPIYLTTSLVKEYHKRSFF